VTPPFIPIVLCAGFGTRLQPLTHFVPKAAAPIAGAPVAYHSIRLLLEMGFETVHCNTHYLAEFLRAEITAQLVADGFSPNRVRFWHEVDILETAGGIGNIVHTLAREAPQGTNNHDIIAIAGDVFAKPPLEAMIRRWESRPAKTAALMATRKLNKKRPDVTWIDPRQNEVVGFGADRSMDDPSVEGRVFSTHQIIDQAVVLGSPVIRESSRDLFYRSSLRRGMHILSVDYPDSLPWFDIGDHAAYAEALLLTGLSTPNPTSLTRLSALPNQCLVIYSAADHATKKNTGPEGRASAKSLSDCFRGFSSPDTCPGEGLETQSKSSLTLERVTLEPQWGLLTHLHTQPRCRVGSGALVGERVRELCASASYLSLTPEEGLPSSLDSKKPRLVFSVSGLGWDLPHPLLVPLEFLELPNPLEPSLSLRSLYSSSQTFLLFH
jgi:NDP-sugar pyrophosphorylase family protein